MARLLTAAHLEGSSMADDEQHLDLFPLPARMGEELGAGQ